MAVHEDLAVQYHQQDTDYYCGGASAQMVLAQIGAGLLDQDDLYADNHAHSVLESGWYTAPDGLTWTLNDRRPAELHELVRPLCARETRTSSRGRSAGRSTTTRSRRWRWSTAGRTGSSCGATKRARRPQRSDDNTYSITAFDVNNPWPPTPTPGPPPPHTAADVCGSGGERGVADEHISYATWQADYMTGIPSGYWGGKFVAVCDPEPPAETPGRARPPKRLPGDQLHHSRGRSASRACGDQGVRPGRARGLGGGPQGHRARDTGARTAARSSRPLLLHRPDAAIRATHPGAGQRRRPLRDVPAGGRSCPRGRRTSCRASAVRSC